MVIYDAICAIADWMWGTPMLIVLVGGGIVLSVATGFIQIRRLGYCLNNTIIKSLKEKNKTENISGLQAVLSAMSGTIGTGNIVGVGTAIAMGGPGAVFWMWIVGLLAMAIKYCEALSAVKFRRPAKVGNGYLWDAGPSMYLRMGVPNKKIGKFLAVCSALVMTWGLVMSGPEHTSAIVDVFDSAFGLNRTISTVICVIIVAGVMLGGMKRFVKLSEAVVPVMSIIYVAFGIVILIMNIGNIPAAFGAIFKGAFSGTAAAGGFVGAGIGQAIRWGTARGMYSSDAGTGIQSIMHGQADVQHPVEQGMFGVFEVFVDTIIICTFTALVICSTGVWQTGADGSELALMAFTQSLGGLGTMVLSLALFFFAITSVTGMQMFMDRHISANFGPTTGKVFNVIYLVLMVAGGWSGFSAVVPFTDLYSAIEIFFNMAGLVMMAGIIKETTKDYFENFIKQEK